jgi:hypothetical protein
MVLARRLDVNEMVLDSENIYLITRVMEKVENKYVESNRIEWIPKKGGILVTLVEEKLHYYNLVIDENYIYWITANQAASGNNINYFKKIRKTGGEPIILFQEEAYIGPPIQDKNNIFVTSKLFKDPNTTKLIQINKSDNSIQILFEKKVEIDNLLIHKGYVYWLAWTYDMKMHETNAKIQRKIIDGNTIETIISDDYYGYPYPTEKGIYWLGDYLIYLDDASKKITPIVKSSLLHTGMPGIVGGYKTTENYISNIIYIDEKNLYYSEVFSAVPGFKSCTDVSEQLKKYSFAEGKYQALNSTNGEANYYRINNEVFIISECNSSYYRMLNIQNDKITENTLIGGCKYFAVDDTRIFWVNSVGDLWSGGRNSGY